MPLAVPPTLASANPFSPSCALNSCLNQVIGLVDYNPEAQYAACTSAFGAPAVATVTPSADVVFVTSTSTVSYVDIVVSLTTQISTLEETVTSYETDIATATEYTTTQVSTISTTVTGYGAVPTVAKRKNRKRGNCHIKPSSTLTLQTEEPETEATTAPATTSSSEPAVPIASHCANLEEYSSACSCITAVEATQTITASAAISTSVIYETVSEAVPSVSESVVSVVVTTVVVKPATTVATTTVRTALQSTTTAVTAVATGKAQLMDGPKAGTFFTMNPGTNYVRWSTSETTVISFPAEGGTPYLTSNPSYTMWMYQLSPTYGVISMASPELITTPSTYVALTCSVSTAGLVSCKPIDSSLSNFNTIFQCATYMYIAPPGWAFAGCTAVTVRIV
ncbi:hypothetical protein QBC42DRAFT_328514 [Cladorrhinum samala]|uniref:Uncharacterized protein n=1 Tax=Cladorrhinum samala TaxID=585594 RepID=A0AAV9HPJ1_9PEZI|nr:hypothetical protein QBC42DRAFT_328514 [Cladorrhinum samala]